MTKLRYTHHATDRMSLRNISRSMVQATVKEHEERKPEKDGDICFIRQVERHGQPRKMFVIAKPLPEEGKDAWLIKTVWIRGEDDPNRLLHAIRMFFKKLLNRR